MLRYSMMDMCGAKQGICHHSGRGLVQMSILRILYEKPSHGYQIMEELQRITSDKYIPESGVVYTMLRRMEKKVLVTSEWKKKETGADRRVYTLTDMGKKTLKGGLEMVKNRRPLMDSLVQFYDSHFIEKEKGDDR